MSKTTTRICFFEWDLDYDGTTFEVEAIGVTPDIVFADDFANRPIALRVTDTGGLVTIAQGALEVINQPPSIDASMTSITVEEGAVADGDRHV